MPFDASGNFTRVHSWQQDRDSGIRILADRHDAEDDNFGNAFNLTFLRTGTVPMTGNLQMGGNSIKNIDSGSEAAPAMTFELSNQTGIWQPNSTSLAFSSGGVKKFEVNSAGVGIFGDTGFNGTVAVTGSITATGSLIVLGPANFGPSVALNDDAADNGDVYLNFNNHANTIAHAYVGIDPAKKLVLRCTQGEIHSINNFFVDASLDVASTAYFHSSVDTLGAVTSPQFTILGGGASAIFQQGGNPYFNFDASDYLTYDKASNVLNFIIGGTNLLNITATGVNAQGVFSATGSFNTPGTVTAARGDFGSLSVYDAKYYMGFGGGQTVLNFDDNDWMYYDRSNNAWGINITGATVISIGPDRKFNAGGGMHVTGDAQIGNALYVGYDVAQSTYFHSTATYATVAMDAGDFIQYDKANNIMAFNVGGGTNLALYPGNIARIGSLQVYDNRYYLGAQTADTPMINFDDNDYMRYIRSQNRYDLIVGNGTQFYVIPGEVGIPGIARVGGDMIANGKVFAVSNPGDGVAFECKDNPANSHTTALRFVNNGITAEYGKLGYSGSVDMYLSNLLGNIQFNAQSQYIYTNGHSVPAGDGNWYSGTSALRWYAVYGAAGFFQTSDDRSKVWRGAPTSKELKAARRITDALGFYTWGGDETVRFGPRAQEVARILMDEGVEADHNIDFEPDVFVPEDERPHFKNGLLDFSSWEESTYLDADGKEVVRPAGNRYSMEYSQLSLFLIKGLEARIAYLEGYGERK